MHGALGDRVQHWTTLNEPWCSAFLGYASGDHAPGRREPASAVRAAHHLLLGHGAVGRDAIRARGRESRVGITLNLYAISAAVRPTRPTRRPRGASTACATGSSSTRCWCATRRRRRIGSEACVRRAATGDGDGLGDRRPRSAEVLERVHRDYPAVPLYITENGAAFEDVSARTAVDDSTGVNTSARLDAIAAGVPLRGSSPGPCWTTIEWAWGYTRRFGLVYVDYLNQSARPRPAHCWYSDVIARHGLLDLTPAEYRSVA